MTAEYYFDKGACIPVRVHTVVVSVQHSEKVLFTAHRSCLKVYSSPLNGGARLYSFDLLLNTRCPASLKKNF